MSENPFKIIRPTDQPPESLRKDVMSSVKFVMLMMRFVQLFVADLGMSMFDKVRHISSDGQPSANSGKDRSGPDL
ncbi:MAG: hypothetical protein IPN38_18480 [Flavobacteriales bacterium]|nr:hypothetical protein [Flavobacteriales bacterium]MBL0036512.1 hypothetical protein [Flavobacteriales bacterium]